MVGFPSPFGGSDEPSEGTFDPEHRFNPGSIPAPGEFLAGHEVLTDDHHVAFHRLTEELFERRGVYDVTFGYNLARLNLDRRHPNAGFRYAEESEDPSVLRAEFTPTTPFCPQSDTLTNAASRAWNGLCDEHDYDFVRVRVATMHHGSEEINEALAALETDDESAPPDTAGDESVEGNEGPEPGGARGDCGPGDGQPSRGDGPNAPF